MRPPRRLAMSVSSILQRFNVVDMNQSNMGKTIVLGVVDRDPVFAQGNEIPVMNFVGVAVGKFQDEWLKRIAMQPFADSFKIHGLPVLERKSLNTQL